MANSLQEIDLWRTSLGLLPVPLFAPALVGSRDPEMKRYILLNGNTGNFCLALRQEGTSSEGRSHAWSSNVAHYVSVGNDVVEVQRWDRSRSALERYSYSSVCDRLEEFHTYLEKDAPAQGVSIISHSIGVFRQLRALLGRQHTGTDCLAAFLYLVARAAGRDSAAAASDWGATNRGADWAGAISSSNWEELENQLIGGRPQDGLMPELTLMLRHASGPLFQEAHYEVAFGPDQLTLNGFLPLPVKVKPRRLSGGVHFTPPALARTLVESALIRYVPLCDRLTVFDPACGSGEFLREVLRQLELRHYSGKLRLIGWDVSEAATDMARFVLEWEKMHSPLSVDCDIACRDSLADDWPGDLDIILMNPPFISWQDMDKPKQEAVRVSLGKLAAGRPDFSYVFLSKAERCLRQGGLLGSVVPASFLDGSSADSLRSMLAETMSPILIARLGSHMIFQGAIIDVALYLGAKGVPNDQPTIAFWADHRSVSAAQGLRRLRKSGLKAGSYPILGEGFSIDENPGLGCRRGNWAPRPYSARRMLDSLDYLPRVGDLFYIRQGVRSGNNSAFLLNKACWMDLPRRERQFFRPAVINESIREGRVSDIAYIFYPYGSIRIETEKDLQQFVGSYYDQVLLAHKAKLMSRARVRHDKWWNLTEHRAWQTARQPKLVSTYFGDSGSFAYDAGGDYVVVQGHAWLPKATEGPGEVSLAYLAILNSKVFSELLSATSNNVGGGQWNLSAKFVSEMPMPDLYRAGLGSSIVHDLREIGRQIVAGKMYAMDIDRFHETVEAAYRVDRH